MTILHILTVCLELGVLGVAFVWAGSCRNCPQSWRFFRRLSSPVVGPAVVGFLAFAVSLAAVHRAEPLPRIHDEFSNLLAADTFANGRLTNPTHPMWRHFESFHIIQNPSYASKYPPAQGLLLAVGKVLLGREAYGLVLVNALAAAMVCWMMRGWLPGRWAFVGGLFAALHPTMQLDWGRSFVGGSLAVLAGALVYGALARIRRRRQVRDAVMLAVGIVLLANIRPFEGLLLCLPAAVAFLICVLRRDVRPIRTSLLKTVAPCALLLLLGAVAMATYNQRVTGDFLQFAYQEHESQYGISPLFLWQSPREAPEYQHAVIEDFHSGWAMRAYRYQSDFASLFRIKTGAVLRIGLQLLQPSLALPLLMLPWVVRNPKYWLLLAGVSTVFFGSLSVCWMSSHYVAPMLGPLLLLAVQGLRRLSLSIAVSRQRRAHGAFALASLAVYVIVFQTTFLGIDAARDKNHWSTRRARIADELAKTEAAHLILVRYDKNHNPHQEWVYNGAHIDGSKVVWARSMTPELDEQLVGYFANRKVWVLNADQRPASLAPATGE